jgi:hypothetical protein
VKLNRRADFGLHFVKRSPTDTQPGKSGTYAEYFRSPFSITTA